MAYRRRFAAASVRLFHQGGDIYNRLADCTRTTCEIFEHMGTILLIIVVLLLIGALPHWPYSSGWGYYPSGGLSLLLLILIILLVLRYI
jgi:NhaP-type Na+/H+ or K+/H+ antiporter